MVMVVHGFPTKIAALQFEWHWQHPSRSRIIAGKPNWRRGLKGFESNACLLFTLLHLDPWQRYPLKIMIADTDVWTWYQSQVASAVVDLPPSHMEVTQGDLKSLDVYRSRLSIEEMDREQVLRRSENNDGPSVALSFSSVSSSATSIDECIVCHKSITGSPHCANCAHCWMRAHLECLAQFFLAYEAFCAVENPAHPRCSDLEAKVPFLPRGGHCPICTRYNHWSDIVKRVRRRAEDSAQQTASASTAPGHARDPEHVNVSQSANSIIRVDSGSDPDDDSDVCALPLSQRMASTARQRGGPRGVGSGVGRQQKGILTDSHQNDVDSTTPDIVQPGLCTHTNPLPPSPTDPEYITTTTTTTATTGSTIRNSACRSGTTISSRSGTTISSSNSSLNDSIIAIDEMQSANKRIRVDADSSDTDESDDDDLCDLPLTQRLDLHRMR